MACMQRNFIRPIFYNVFKLSLNEKKNLKYFPWFVRFIVFVFVWTSECGNLTIWNSFDDEPPIHWMITTHFMKIALPKFLTLSLFLFLSHSKTSLESLKCDECKNSLSLKENHKIWCKSACAMNFNGTHSLSTVNARNGIQNGWNYMKTHKYKCCFFPASHAAANKTKTIRGMREMEMKSRKDWNAQSMDRAHGIWL